MVWTAWNNGQHHDTGAGYGFKIDPDDRDRTFLREWAEIEVRLPMRDGAVTAVVNVNKRSFWERTCREVISRDIGAWLISEGHAPWPEGSPPRFTVRSLGGPQFEITGLA